METGTPVVGIHPIPGHCRRHNDQGRTSLVPRPCEGAIKVASSDLTIDCNYICEHYNREQVGTWC